MDRSRRVVCAGALSIVLLTTACGRGSGTDEAGGAYGTGGTTSSGSPSARPSDGTAGDPTTGGSGVGKTLMQGNYQFVPAKLAVQQGDTITVSDTNPTTPHTFTVEGTDIDVANDAQSSQEVMIELEPGTYTFFCRYHRRQGMEGTLTVT